jgi:histidinol-phosphate aminotransferase
MTTSIKKNVITRSEYIPGRNKSAIKTNRSGKKSLIQLSSNTSILGPSPWVIKAVSDEMMSIQYYPDASARLLKNTISKKIGVGPRNLLIGNGSAEIIDLISRAILDQKDEVILGNPTFPKYEISAQICNAAITKIAMKDSKHDMKTFLKNISENTKLIFIDTPCNPVGTALSAKEISDFISSVPENILIVIDEAYHEFNDPQNHLDYSNFLEKKNVVFMRTLSKAYGVAGLRIGYLIGNPEIISYINKVREVFNVNSLAIIGGVAALEDEEHLNNNLSLTYNQKHYLYSRLDDLGFCYYKSEANFIFINSERDLESVDKFLLDRGLIIRPVQLDGYKTGHIRVTIGKPEENSHFIDSLKEMKKVIPVIN